MRKIIRILSFVAITSFLFTGCASSKKNNNGDNQTKEIVTVNVGETISPYTNLQEMIKEVKPTVVDIYAYISSTSYSAGSGVIIGKSDDGYYVITNHHVIDQASSFDIVTYPSEDINESKTYTSKVVTLVGSSPSNDIAVLRVKTTDELKVATFIDDSDTVKVGTDVVAIGNPLGILGGTVTKGIISATAREVAVSNVGYMKLFQTDAAINSGNSGGALFNSDGLLVGIVNSGYTSYEGLNFAIPANDARKAMNSLINTYKQDGSSYGYVEGEKNLGITLNSAQIYTDSNLNNSKNVVYVSSVEASSDAYKANVYDYDSFSSGKNDTFYAVTKINGTKIEDVTTANSLLSEVLVGSTLSLEVENIAYTRNSSFFGGTTYFYLSGTTKTISINVTQYIYNLPTSK